jgi:uncharacterized protein (TIGR00251 family)
VPETPDDACYAWLGKDLHLHTWVIPRSSRSHIGTVANGRLQVHLHAPPAQGSANKELIQLIAKAFGVPKSAVTIARGSRTRNKTLRIDNPRTLPSNLG